MINFTTDSNTFMTILLLLASLITRKDEKCFTLPQLLEDEDLPNVLGMLRGEGEVALETLQCYQQMLQGPVTHPGLLHALHLLTRIKKKKKLRKQ